MCVPTVGAIVFETKIRIKLCFEVAYGLSID